MNISDVRKQFLEDSQPALAEIRARMLDAPSKYPAADGDFLLKYFHVISEMMQKADDPVQIAGLSEGSISDRVDAVMQAVASGQIDIDQGKRLIEMLQAGFEITELQDLIGKLAAAGVEIE